MGEYKELPTGRNAILNKARRLSCSPFGEPRVGPDALVRAGERSSPALRRAENCRHSPGWAGEGTRPYVVLGSEHAVHEISYGFRCIDSLGRTEHFRGAAKAAAEIIELSLRRDG